VHKTKDAKLLFEELNITEIFNVPYCPQFNGIESYFSQIKATYKKLLLKYVIKEAHYDTMGLIKQSIESMSNENAKSCVRYALAYIENSVLHPRSLTPKEPFHDHSSPPDSEHSRPAADHRSGCGCAACRLWRQKAG
jgi:hypothetical protein